MQFVRTRRNLFRSCVCRFSSTASLLVIISGEILYLYTYLLYILATQERTLYTNAMCFFRETKKMVSQSIIMILKQSLIRDRLVFGIIDNSVRERLLRDPELTLQTAIERVRSAELTNAQLKQIKADQKITEELPIHHVKSNSEHSYKNREKNY